jgi:hypothetical protein
MNAYGPAADSTSASAKQAPRSNCGRDSHSGSGSRRDRNGRRGKRRVNQRGELGVRQASSHADGKRHSIGDPDVIGIGHGQRKPQR